jgi:hypothetical protein
MAGWFRKKSSPWRTSRFQPIWVDLESPTVEEKRWIKQHYGLSIPEDAMDDDIEESARFYEEDNGELHIRSDFLIDDDEDPRSVRVAFILNQHNKPRSCGVLFSIHDEDVPVFRLLRACAPRARPDRRRQGRAAQAVRRRRRVLGRHAGRHLRRPGKGQQAGAVRRCDRRRARKCWAPSPARKT